MDRPKFHDHFSERACGYAKFRPHYPRELIEYLARQTKNAVERSGPWTVWEAGCGSGQLSVGLAEFFDRVIATDASADQIAQAPAHPRIEFRVARAEASGLGERSVDLAVAAQAAHWFDLDGYYAEVRRVVRPGGLVGLVVYGIHVADDPAIDNIVKQFYRQTLAAYWPPQRRLVEEEYRTLPFPLEEMPTSRFEMRERWTRDEMLGYVETWSATTALAKASGRETIDAFRDTVAAAWGDAESRRTIRWPLALRLGKV